MELQKFYDHFLQLTALKDQIREAAAARDADIEEAKRPLVAQIKDLEQKASAASRMESMMRSARKAASKADGQIQVWLTAFLAALIPAAV